MTNPLLPIKFITQHPCLVQNLWKFHRKTPRKSTVKLCVNIKNFIQSVEISTFPLTSPHFPTHFLTTAPPLAFNRLFHFSTTPTTTITKYI